MNKDELLTAVIAKYELSQPVPSDVRAFIEKSRRDGLAAILKQGARRALPVTAVVTFFLWIKKFGLSVSIVKSAVAVTAAITLGAGAIAAGSVYGTVKLTDYLKNRKADVKINEPAVTGKSVMIDKKNDRAPEVILYSVAVSKVEMDNTAGKVLSGYTDTVIRELRRKRGQKAAIAFTGLDRYHKADKILSISIIKLEENREAVYRISAKIINSSDSRLLRHESLTTDKEQEIDSSLKKLAGKILSGP